jgi:NADH dehydrogenase
VVLLEASPRILEAYPEELSDAAVRQLETLCVEVKTGARVSHIDETGVEVGERRLPTRTVIWAAGVQPSPLGRTLGVPLERGQVPVEPDLTVPGHPRVFVIGDLARIEQDGRLVPGVAPAAMQMGDHAAGNLLRSLRDEPMTPFRYRDKGSLATVGRRRAVAVFGRARLTGAIAWLAWLAVHIFFLIGFRNRLVVLITWAWAYMTYERTARLILSYGSKHSSR